MRNFKRRGAGNVGKRKRTGRPTKYDPDVAQEVIDRLTAGETLSAICRDEGMPKRTTFLNWVSDDRGGLSDTYARARELGLYAMAEETVEIADDSQRDHVEGERGVVFDSEHVQRSRLRVETRKWMVARLLPHVFGDRVTVAGDKDAPVGVVMLPERRADDGGEQ